MTTSGTYNTLADLTVVQIIDEAFRRLKIATDMVTAEMQFSARLSLDLMFADWVNDGNHQFIIDLQTHDCVVDDASFLTPEATIDVLDMVYNFNHQDIQIKPISREDYLYINDKTATGQPVCYFVDKTAVPPTVYLWPVPNLDGMAVKYNRLKQIEDVGTPLDTTNTTVMYAEAICAGLAARLAEKYSDPATEQALLIKADRIYARATNQDRDRAPYVMKPRLGRRYYYGV